MGRGGCDRRGQTSALAVAIDPRLPQSRRVRVPKRASRRGEGRRPDKASRRRFLSSQTKTNARRLVSVLFFSPATFSVTFSASATASTKLSSAFPPDSTPFVRRPCSLLQCWTPKTSPTSWARALASFRQAEARHPGTNAMFCLRKTARASLFATSATTGFRIRSPSPAWRVPNPRAFLPAKPRLSRTARSSRSPRVCSWRASA